MKKHDVEYLLGYGIQNFKQKAQSSSDGHPNDGKWYQRLDTGFVCGDRFTVIRFISLDEYTVLKEPK